MKEAWPEQGGSNPFDSERACAHSAYLSPQNTGALTERQETIQKEFAGWIQEQQYPCVGAKAAINSGAYRMGIYEASMTDSGAMAGLARDLWEFVQEQPEMGSDFTTFAACFTEAMPASESEFESQLWAVLQSLYDVDRLWDSADPKISTNPDAEDFGFSFAGRGFFVIGLHPEASRLARRFFCPTLVFNAHAQFDTLKADGRYPKMQAAIRARDIALQGSINPMLANFGERSEARQYAGRAVEEEWRCPFHRHHADTVEE